GVRAARGCAATSLAPQPSAVSRPYHPAHRAGPARTAAAVARRQDGPPRTNRVSLGGSRPALAGSAHTAGVCEERRGPGRAGRGARVLAHTGACQRERQLVRGNRSGRAVSLRGWWRELGAGGRAARAPEFSAVGTGLEDARWGTAAFDPG